MRPSLSTLRALVVQRRLYASSNWATNIQFSNKSLLTPHDIHDLQQMVAESKHCRVMGSTHSFSPIADCDDALISLSFMKHPPSLDYENMTVTVHGGSTYWDVIRFLAPRKCCLPNLASLPHITVAGAISTGSHGSGVGIGNLASMVSKIDFVKSDGSLQSYSRGDTDFNASLVSLGCLGVVSSITLDIVPAFSVDQIVLKDVPESVYYSLLHDINQAWNSVSAFINFKTKMVDCLWLREFIDSDNDAPYADKLKRFRILKQLVDAGSGFRDHPVLFYESHLPVVTTTTSSSDDVLTFFMNNGSPVNMPNICLHSEYFVPLELAEEALTAVSEVAGRWPGWDSWDGLDPLSAGPVIMSEIRFMKGDSVALSPSRDRDTMSIHFTCNRNTAAVIPLIEELEMVLRPFSPRPHWGKLFKLNATDIRDMYKDPPRNGSSESTFSYLNNFALLRQKHDPHLKFDNEFLRRCFNVVK